jgi:hypothetical protein
MTKHGVWRYLSVIMAVAMVLGIGTLALSSGPARADEGTWTIETVDNEEVVSTSLALDSHDYPHISYSTGGLASLHYARWTGSDWTKQTVDPDPAWATSMALDRNEQPHIGYSGFISLKYAYSTGGVWTTEPVIPPEMIIVWDCSLALDSSDQPHMVSSFIAPGPPEYGLLYMYRTDEGWDGELIYDDFVISSSLALDGNNVPRIAFSNGSLLYTDGGTPQPVDPANPDVIWSTSLALDSNDRPNIAYAGAGVEAGSLYYARWTGTTWVNEMVDPTPYVMDCSLALDSQNRPHICYLVVSENFFLDDGGDGDEVVVGTLKYAHWTGTYWDIQTIDQEAAAMADFDMKTLDQKAEIFQEKIDLPISFFFFGGKFSSIAVDSHDIPHISYGSLLPVAFDTSLHYAQFVPYSQALTMIQQPKYSPPLPRLLNPAQMSLQFLNISPQQASANQPVTITTNVVNTGDEAGNYNIALKINGQVEESRMVSVGPKASQPVKFTVTRDQPGTYTVDIVDKSGSFTILGDSSSATSSKTGALIAIACICILIVATITALLLRRA